MFKRVEKYLWILLFLVVLICPSPFTRDKGQRVPSDRSCIFWDTGSTCTWKNYKPCDYLKVVNCGP